MGLLSFEWGKLSIIDYVLRWENINTMSLYAWKKITRRNYGLASGQCNGKYHATASLSGCYNAVLFCRCGRVARAGTHAMSFLPGQLLEISWTDRSWMHSWLQFIVLGHMLTWMLSHLLTHCYFKIVRQLRKQTCLSLLVAHTHAKIVNIWLPTTIATSCGVGRTRRCWMPSNM